MKGLLGFMFFLLFMAGLALVNLRGMRSGENLPIASAIELADTAWRPTHLGEMPLGQDTEMFIQFNGGNAIIGHGGCNRFFADFQLTNGEFAAGPIGATRMACPEPANSYELSFLDSIRETKSVTGNDSALAFLNAAGNVVSRFVPAALVTTDN